MPRLSVKQEMKNKRYSYFIYTGKVKAILIQFYNLSTKKIIQLRQFILFHLLRNFDMVGTDRSPGFGNDRLSVVGRSFILTFIVTNRYIYEELRY